MPRVHEFDLIVIGAGSGTTLLETNKKVALIERGPMGGTCLNRGCIPSKILIHHADVAETIQRSKEFWITSKMTDWNWKKIIETTSDLVDSDARKIERNIRNSKNITLFKGTGKFVGPRTLKVNGQLVRGKKIVIAAGTRPSIPPVEGLDKVPFMTSKEALRLKKQPKVLTIIGGGYIAAELAHFYGALGTKINIIQRNAVLVPNEDAEIAKKFTEIFSKKYNVYLGHTAKSVSKSGGIYKVNIERKAGGGKKTITSDALLVATGRKPNTDILQVEKAGVRVNKHGYIRTNQYLETTAKNIWALGDIVGNYLFKHSANLESEYVYSNCFEGKRLRVNYLAMPHAVFSSPQIAGVGATEKELQEKGKHYALGKYYYKNTGMGEAFKEKDGFVKIMADPHTKKILGCHIIGPEASTLIHEVIVAMRANLKVDALIDAVHIHPALPEVVQRAVYGIQW